MANPNFISSGYVFAFPTALRNQTTGKYTTEDNLATIFRAAAGKEDGYTLNKNPLEFVIHGHYFKIENAAGISYPATAYILEDDATKTLRNADGESAGSTTLDDAGLFKALTFSSISSVPNCTVYSLDLLNDSGELLNKIPALSEITVGPGILTDATNGVITSAGTISLPNYNVSGAYGPTHSKNLIDWTIAYNGSLRIPEFTLDNFGKISTANTYVWPVSNTHYVSQISASQNIRPLLLGASIGSYEDLFYSDSVYYKTYKTYFNDAIKVDLTGQTPVLVAPIFSGTFSGNITTPALQADTIYQALVTDQTAYKPILVGNGSSTGYYNVNFNNNVSINLRSGIVKATNFDGNLTGNVSGSATTAGNADYAVSIPQTYSNANNFRPLLLGNWATTNSSQWTVPAVIGDYKGSTYYSTTIFANTSTGTLYANKFVGTYDGAIETANKIKANNTTGNNDKPIALFLSTISDGNFGNLYYNSAITANVSTGTITATTFNGNATTATTADKASRLKIQLLDTNNDRPLLFAPAAPTSGSFHNIYYHTSITANASTGVISALIFSGTLSGKVGTVSIGTRDTGNKVIQGVYVHNGTISSGQAVYWSTTAPGTNSGRIGDIWIQY